MNINKQYAWQPADNTCENNPLLSRDLLPGKTTAIFNLLLQPGWMDYNQLYVFRKSLHQQEYKVLTKGIDAGSKQQISNLFSSLVHFVQRIYHLSH